LGFSLGLHNDDCEKLRLRRSLMDKLLRVFFYLGFIAFAAGLPNAASADIEVTISDQVTTITSASGNPGFNLKWITTSSTGAGHSATWNLLKCSPHPCSVFFPSGGTTPKPGVDTFEFRDTCPDPSTCSFGAGRVEKWDDSMLAGIELKGIRITALPGVTSRWVTVTITTEVKDFLALSPGTHTVWGLLDGTFTEQPPKPGGDKLSLACPKPANVNEANVLKPCAELALVVYANHVMSRPDQPNLDDYLDFLAINDAGVVVGNKVIFDGQHSKSAPFMCERAACLTSRTNLTDLTNLQASPAGINNAGQIVGRYYIGVASHAFLYQNGKTIDLGTLGGTNSEATAINEAGHVVGVSDTASGERHAFLYADGKMTDLGTLGGISSQAADINDADDVVGMSKAADDEQHAFLYRNGKCRISGRRLARLPVSTMQATLPA
jgi:probable HAF family extracellular repeat protein